MCVTSNLMDAIIFEFGKHTFWFVQSDVALPVWQAEVDACLVVEQLVGLQDDVIADDALVCVQLAIDGCQLDRLNWSGELEMNRKNNVEWQWYHTDHWMIDEDWWRQKTHDGQCRK